MVTPRTPAGTFAPAYEGEQAHDNPAAVKRAARRRLAANRECRAGPRTLGELAHDAGIPRDTLASALSGRRPLPWSTVERLAMALGVDVADLA